MWPRSRASVAGRAVVDACQGIDIAAWDDAGWRVSSLTGVGRARTREGSGAASTRAS